SVEGWIVSPRKSRKKSPCFSSTVTSIPARASRNPSIIPAGPPPTTQQRVLIRSVTLSPSRKTRRFGMRFGTTSEAGAAFSDHVAEQQQRSEQHHDDRCTDFDAAHRQCAIAGARTRKPPRKRSRRHRKRCDHRNGDRGAERHHEGCRNAGREQPLR